MSIGEIKLIVLAILAVGLIAGGGWTGYHFTAQHYEIVLDKAKEASDAALDAAQQRVITAEAAQKAAEDREEVSHAKQAAADSVTRTQLDDGVRNLTASLRAFTLPAPVADSAGGRGTTPSANGSRTLPPSRAELDAAFAEFNSASDALVGACQHDSLEIVGALNVQPK